MYNWRARHVDKEQGFPGDRIVFASGSGALGVRLDSRVREQGEPPEGEEATPDLMQRTVSLLWRAAIMCLLVCLLFGFARLVST
jgi:adenosylcobinamide-phosphate synthase